MANELRTLHTIELREDAADAVRILLDGEPVAAEDLDMLIQALGAQRQLMQPPVPVALPEDGAALPVALGAGWFAGSMYPHGNVFGLRHPMFGWLTFQLPADFPEQLAESLRAIPPIPLERH